MTGGDASLLFKSSVATSVSNLDSYRRDGTNLDKRKEGWTEVWGIGDAGRGLGKGTKDEQVCGWKARPDDWDMEHVVAQRTKESSTPYPSIPLTLSQHRVAWQEQLVLRIANVPHIVLNSSYLASESTGSLPYLKDVGSISSKSDMTSDGDNSDRPPALVGRRNPGGGLSDQNNNIGTSAIPSHSHIIDYLRSSTGHDINLDQHLDEVQKADGMAYSTMIAHTLSAVIAALRYGDYRAWEEVYRHQSIAACLDPNSPNNSTSSKKRRGFFNWAAWFQTWSERTVALKELKLSNTTLRGELFDGDDVNIDRAVAMAKRCYTSLNARLKQSGGGTTLLGTERLTTVDVLLFAHLAEALCDLHLITVLSEYDTLIKFFQSTYEKYFGQGYGADKEWVQWNDRANSTNAFNHVPMGGGRTGIRNTEYKDAIKLMQSMALHCHDLVEALADAVLVRGKEDNLAVAGRTKKAGQMFHRWRMHGTLSEKDDASGASKKKKQNDSDSDEDEQEDEMTRKNRQHIEKLKKDAKNNDELWVSGVILGSILAYVLAAASAAKV